MLIRTTLYTVSVLTGNALVLLDHILVGFLPGEHVRVNPCHQEAVGGHQEAVGE